MKTSLGDGRLPNSNAKPSIVKQRTRHVKLTKEEQAALDSDLDEFFGRPLSLLSQTELYDAFKHYKVKGEEVLRDEDEISAERYRRLMLGIANYGCTNRAEWLFGNLSFELTRPTIAETHRARKMRAEGEELERAPRVVQDNREGDNDSSGIPAITLSSARRQYSNTGAQTVGRAVQQSCATLAMQKMANEWCTDGSENNEFFDWWREHTSWLRWLCCSPQLQSRARRFGFIEECNYVRACRWRDDV
ncbi:hypothetical protein K491DRAFT_683270 [Lophiostoma macrostomum CBS 122681]|uniref:Uncharacterized protein n=1 Tax=Lophiostoma macrostomum CBS 122681 TaxID=1314788 RepID=A0A6A6SQL3_9PLEO|nr:hypothetical protein K491DRAFT_683270 [Lophiostoma macrostomum CBS 122681]